MPKALRVGLTGGIACGKSEVLRRLAAAGLHTLDLDRVAHEVMAPSGPAYEDVVAAFGAGVLGKDGTIDRKALGGLVFGDEAARRRLNWIVHPRVRAEESRRVAGWASEADAVVVVDAALLVESGLHLRFDRLVVVHCPPETQLRRLMTRDSIDEGAAQARLLAQLPTEEKRLFAHLEVGTGGSLEETWAQADALARELRRLARQPQPRVALDRGRALGCLKHGPSHGPRGLDPYALVREIGRTAGIEMERLAALLRPPPVAPWYRAARPDEGPPEPVALSGPLALWSLVRGDADEDFLLAAAASVARLTHNTPDAIGSACVFALALQAAAGGRDSSLLLDHLPRWRSQAEHWSGASFADALGPVLAAATRFPREVAAARQACQDAGGDPDLAGALVGLEAGDAEESAPADWRAAVDELMRLGGDGPRP